MARRSLVVKYVAILKSTVFFFERTARVITLINSDVTHHHWHTFVGLLVMILNKVILRLLLLLCTERLCWLIRLCCDRVVDFNAACWRRDPMVKGTSQTRNRIQNITVQRVQLDTRFFDCVPWLTFA